MKDTKKLYNSPMVELVQTQMADVLSISGLGEGYTDAKDSDNFAPTLWN